RQLALGSERVTIGSASGRTIVLRRAGVAPDHCVLEPIDGGYKLVDQHTEHGTIVNGASIAQKRLDPGDRIELGGFVLVFERLARRRATPGAPASTERAPSGPPAARVPPR